MAHICETPPLGGASRDSFPGKSREITSSDPDGWQPTLIDLPVLRATDIIAVTLERTELTNRPVWVITVRESPGKPPHRRWLPDEAQAFSYAAEQADRHGLLLIDLRDGGDVQ